MDGRERGKCSVTFGCGGSAAWCSKAAWDVHPWEKSHRFHSFGEENGENPTSNAASAALLNEDCYGEMGGFVSLGLLGT